MRKPAFCICKNKDSDQLKVTAQLISACFLNPSTFLIRNFKSLALFSNCAARFVSDLVGNPKDLFSHVVAHLSPNTCLDQFSGRPL